MHKTQEKILVYNYLGYVLILFLVTCYFIFQYQLLGLGIEEHVSLTPEMENLLTSMEILLFKE